MTRRRHVDVSKATLVPRSPHRCLLYNFIFNKLGVRAFIMQNCINLSNRTQASLLLVLLSRIVRALLELLRAYLLRALIRLQWRELLPVLPGATRAPELDSHRSQFFTRNSRVIIAAVLFIAASWQMRVARR